MFSHDIFLIAFGTTQLNRQIAGPPIAHADRIAAASVLMQAHPREIISYMEEAWETHNRLRPSQASQMASALYRPGALANNMTASIAQMAPAFGCFHLIYAYLLENTRMYELFNRVIDLFNSGETLGAASPASRQWLTITEALFYRQQHAHDHAPVSTLTSDSRSDGRAIRRNAYYRMFGMDLNHGTNDNKPYPYTKPNASNTDFVSTFEELLRQIWIAIIHLGSTAGNPTDDAEIQHLARKLFVMLTNRRISGTLTREEFSAVTTLDWLRLAVSFDSEIVKDLRAQAASESERLKKIAERVMLASHGKADDYFELAAPMSALLQGIENQILFDTASFLAFPQIENIITHWSRATGKVLKRMPQPVIRQSAA